MTTRKRRLPRSRSDSGASRRSYARHWTRDEQIENAIADGAELEISPPLSKKEKKKHGL